LRSSNQDYLEDYLEDFSVPRRR